MESTKFKCPYCGKEFTRERTLQVHMCEPKRRHLQKNEKWVQNAFMVFQRFYEIHQKNHKTKTYDEDLINTIDINTINNKEIYNKLIYIYSNFEKYIEAIYLFNKYA